jgi:hypothetical protein
MINTIKKYAVIEQVNYAINKILSIKINLLSLFYFIILLLPLIQTELRIRAGAGWQLYIPLIFLLYFSILVKKKDFYNYSILIIVSLIFISVSNLCGWYLYKDFPLTSSLLQQIKSLEARMGVETVRFFSSILFFFLTIYFIKDINVFQKSLKYFLYTAFFQAIYGFYEFISKIFINILPLLNSKAYSHGTFRVFGTFYEPSQYGQFMLISILVLVLYKSFIKIFFFNNNDFFIKNYKKIFLFMLLMLFASFSRAAMLSGIMTIVIYFIFSMTNIKKVSQIFGFILLLSLLFFTIIKISLTQKELDTWLFLLTSDTGNGGIARINGIFYNLYLSWIFLLKNFLGIGEGSMIIQFGMIPMFPRLLIENGIFIGLFYILFLIKLVFNTKKIIIKQLRINFYILIGGLIIIQMNYSSDNDPWIWFLLALLYSFPKLLKNHILQKEQCEK